ncbi:unnamed protein product [Amoebophrya sp. A120]|nr:unnamed protein product [Amoebophrya sp. A120]|eukprot:GSA120T00018393001.1
MVATSSSDGGVQEPGVVEMMEYVKTLEIDPLRDPHMLWIAEAAYQAALPPDWGEYMDPQGRVYFYCSTSGESSWSHPLDDVYRDMAQSYRDAVSRGGFWLLEEKLAKEEEKTKKELDQWTEGQDDKGERFFHNKSTGKSTYADPAALWNHKLFVKLKLLQAMKERHPSMAVAKKPDPNDPQKPTFEVSGDAQLAAVAIRVQAVIRSLLAKKRFKEMKEKKGTSLTRGVAPSLRGKLRLKVQKTDDGKEELLLSQTTGARRDKAAVRIQSLARSYIVRKRIKPLLAHRRHLGKIVVPIQTRMRIVLAKKLVARMRNRKFIRSATSIQALQRGIKGRERYRRMLTEQGAEKRKNEQIVMMQCAFRMTLAVRRRRRMKEQRRGIAQKTLASAMKSFLAAKKIQMLAIAERPVLCNFILQEDSFVPWRFRLQMAPVKAGKILKKPNGVYELFNSEPAQQAYMLKCIVDIQRVLRGSLVRIAKLRRMMVGRAPVMEALRDALGLVDARAEASVTIQARARGFLVRSRDIEREQLFLRFSREGSKAHQALLLVQQKMKQVWATQYLKVELANQWLRQNATTIQRHWRGYLGRKLVEDLIEESCWPLRGFFEYQQTGPDSVMVQVNFYPSRHFDEYRYFERYGDVEDLSLALEEMELEVALCVDQYLQDRNLLKPSKTAMKRHQPRLPLAESPRPPVSPSGHFLRGPAAEKHFQQTDAEVVMEEGEVEPPSVAEPESAAPNDLEPPAEAEKHEAVEETSTSAPAPPVGEDGGKTERDLAAGPEGAPPDAGGASAATAATEDAAALDVTRNDLPIEQQEAPAQTKEAAEAPSAGTETVAGAAPEPAKVAEDAPPAIAAAAADSAASPPPPPVSKSKERLTTIELETIAVHEEVDRLKDWDAARAESGMPLATNTKGKKEHQGSPIGIKSPKKGDGKQVDQQKEKEKKRKVTNSAFIFTDPDPSAVHTLFKEKAGDYAPDMTDLEARMPKRKSQSPERIPTATSSQAAFDPRRPGSGSTAASPAAAARTESKEEGAGPVEGEEVGGSSPSSSPKRRRKGKFPAPLPRNPFRPELTVEHSVTGKVADRKSYAGEFREGRFYRNRRQYKDLSEREKQSILYDLKEERKRKVVFLAKKKRDFDARQRERQEDERERFHQQMVGVNSELHEREAKRVETLTKWLAEKEEMAKKKKRKEQETIELVIRKKEERQAKLDKLDMERAEERERRLQAAEKKKFQLVKQIEGARLSEHDSAHQRDPHTGEVHRHVHHHIHYHHVTEDGEEELSHAARVHVERESESSVMRKGAENASPLAQTANMPVDGGSRLTEGALQNEAPTVSGTETENDAGSYLVPSTTEEENVIHAGGAATSMSSRSRKDPANQPDKEIQQHVHYHVPHGVNAQNFVEEGGVPPPVELVIPPVSTDETITKPPGPLSPKGLQKLGKRTGLRQFCHNISTAIDSYADTRRPRYLRDKHFVPLPLPHERGNSQILRGYGSQNSSQRLSPQDVEEFEHYSHYHHHHVEDAEE